MRWLRDIIWPISILMKVISLLYTVALAGVYLNTNFHHHMMITGGATIHGRVSMVAKIKEKSLAGLQAFPNETMNMIVPLANTIGSAICSDYQYTYRNREGGRSRIQREWFTLEKAEQKRLHVFAAETLYEVLELAIIPRQGMVFLTCGMSSTFERP